MQVESATLPGKREIYKNLRGRKAMNCRLLSDAGFESQKSAPLYHLHKAAYFLLVERWRAN
jgi:hypothetical protein